MKTVKFREWDCTIKFAKYGNGRTAIQLVDSETYEPICTATVNVVDEDLLDGFVHIKNYSENEGILHTLSSAGIIHDTGLTVPCDHTEANVCQLLYKDEI